MTILKIYQNFFLRNLIVNLLVIGIIFVCIYDEMNYAEKDSLVLLQKICLGYIPMYFGVAFSNMFIIHKFLFRKKYQIFWVVFILYWVCFYSLMTHYFFYVGLGKTKTLSIISLIFNGTCLYFLHVVIMKKVSQTNKDIINFKSELSFLKQQLNPHFLLNAMNNLYGEALTEPDKVPDRILNLSDMLRYQIEATKKDYVLIEEEIDFIKKYIDYYTFQNERLAITQDYEGSFDHIEIPPLFFLPLVENAVKFSAETTAPFITVHLKVKGNDLSFTLKNNFLVCGSRLSSTGIGIGNLKRRLEVHGLHHELSCKKDKNTFIVKLNIWDLPTAV
ncbi:sensor histidine kinase [Flavobacterium geliluteum]|uniref:Histidine kinase n=1 Tax=Flavobacterium geliluteum TaxID=2816120 RepID=A0A941AXL3_9FLAO|nr:histidine kinase [Flavobacterium geliluteum]MBP4136707.1 histidine kinase [Flavobacterium geliluteum]